MPFLPSFFVCAEYSWCALSVYRCPVQVDYALRRARVTSKTMQASTIVFIPKTIDAHLVARPRRPKIRLLLFYTMYPCLAAVLTYQKFFQEVLKYRIKQCMIETTRRDNHIETYLARDVEPSRVSALHWCAVLVAESAREANKRERRWEESVPYVVSPDNFIVYLAYNAKRARKARHDLERQCNLKASIQCDYMLDLIHKTLSPV